MTLAEKLVLNFNELNETEQKEVVDFVEFLKHKKEKELFNLMDEVIVENKIALDELSK
ncbi:hypothetical protein SDC9_140540 [bioreactor metagenome]|uniref:DUF2281 domain-containing protein n=1 Tax=bioreactor metagenome TaxID=1076179 RepID=A0A645DXT3_9ZZZZ